jgi:hypothetical protein
MARIACESEGASREVTNPLDTVNTSVRTGWDFTCAVKLDVRCQVIGKVDRFTVGLVVFKSELICSRINLAEVVNTRVGSTGGTGFDEIWNCNYHEYRKNQNSTPKYDTAK